MEILPGNLRIKWKRKWNMKWKLGNILGLDYQVVRIRILLGVAPISIADSWCSVFIVTLCPAHWQSHGTPTKRIKKNDPLGPPSQC